MTEEEFSQVLQIAIAEFKKHVPNPKTRNIGYYKNAYGNWQRGSTGNMAFNASKLKQFRSFGVIYVDDAIAPYVPYTNEPWISPRWKGHKNPNQSWFEKATHKVAKHIAQQLKGRLVKK